MKWGWGQCLRCCGGLPWAQLAAKWQDGILQQKSFFFFKYLCMYVSIYLAVPGLSCGMWDLCCSMWDL